MNGVVNKDIERLTNMVHEHDKLLRGNGDRDGLLHSVRMLIEDMKSRKRLQQTILVGVVGLLLERIFSMLSRLV